MVRLIFELVLDKKLEMYVSPLLNEELKKKFDFFQVNQATQDEIQDFINTKGILVEPTVKIEVNRDKKDNFLLELSETANADYLVTRDKDLLELTQGRWKHTIIIKPEDFLPFLRSIKIVQ